MDTKIITIDEKSIDMKKIREAATLLNNGGLVAFPTETVYGLGADALNAEAVDKIYEAKGRPRDNPLIVHIHSIEQLSILAREISAGALLLANFFWPGPLTMILPALATVPKKVTGGLNTVAIRMPRNAVALAILKETKNPIAAPSANLSGRPSPTKGVHVIEDLLGKIDGIVVAENAKIGIESTVIDLTSKPAVILRPGSVTIEEISKYIQVVDNTSEKEGMVKSPGTKYKHYAPKSDLIIVTGSFEEKLNKIKDILMKNKGIKTGVFITEEMSDLLLLEDFKGDVFKIVGSIKHPEEIIANLYALLRDFDMAEVEVIYMEEIPEEITGIAYRNRVEKASGGKSL